MKSRYLTLSAIVLAALIIMAYIPIIPLPLVPITIQNLGIMLTGALLGGRKGFVTVALLLLLAMIGLPVLTGGSGGFAHFFWCKCWVFVGLSDCRWPDWFQCRQIKTT